MELAPVFGLERISDKEYFYGEIEEFDGLFVVSISEDDTCDECGHPMETLHFYESLFHLSREWKIREKLYI